LKKNKKNKIRVEKERAGPKRLFNVAINQKRRFKIN
jgi:hypothetical protein